MNKSDTTNTDDTTIDKSESGVAQATWLLKTATAMKLGKQATGGISYEILTDRERTEPMIKITGNDGGGYVSKEILSFKKIEDCIKKQEPDQPFPSKVLQAVFTGRSTNNGGFLAAILRAEKLLALAPDAEGRHVIAGDWAEWKASLLAEPGQPIVAEAAPTVEAARDETAAEPSQADETKTPTATRRKK